MRDESVLRHRLQLEFGVLVTGILATCALRIVCNNPWPEIICELSAFSLAMVGVFFARDIDQRFDNMLCRLFDRDALSMPPEQQTAFRSNLRQAADRASIFFGLALPTILASAYAVLRMADGDGQANLATQSLDLASVVKIASLICDLLAAFVVGRYLGRGILYGLVGTFLRRADGKLVIKPGHPDGAAGLKPVGQYYLLNAALVMIPAAFFACWFLVMKLWLAEPSATSPVNTQKATTESQPLGQDAQATSPEDASPASEISRSTLKKWANWYLAFFFVSVICEVLAFILPLWFFHCEMVRQKCERLRIADVLSNRILEVKAKLLEEQATGRIKALEDEVAGMIARYEALETLPIWPFDRSMRRRFTIGNVVLVVPVVVGNLDTIKATLSKLL